MTVFELFSVLTSLVSFLYVAIQVTGLRRNQKVLIQLI